jgi:ATP synthase protein I
MLPKKDEIHGPRPASNEAGRVMGVGLQFAAAIVLFLFAGKWVDSKLGTEPWFLLLGVLVGLVGGFVSLYRQLSTPQARKGKEPPVKR